MGAPDVSVRITAQDNATAKVAGVAASFRAMRESSEDAGRGLGRVGNVLGDMARQALGATGPLGRVAEKLLEFGVGTGIFVAVAGAIALAYKALEYFGKAAKDAQVAYDKYMDSLRGGKSPLALVGDQLDQAKLKLQEMQEGQLGQSEVMRAEIRAQTQLVHDLTVQYHDLNTQIHATAEVSGAAVASKRRADALKAEADALKEYNRVHGINPNPNVLTTARGNMMPGDQGTNSGAPWTAAQDFTEGQNRGPYQWADGVTNGSDALKELATDLKNFGEGSQRAFDTAIEGAQAFGVNLGFVKKGLGLYAAVHGAYDEVLAISAFARGLFGDPSQFKAAATAQISAARWFSLAAKYGAGGGGGSASYGGGGGLSSNGFNAQQQAAQNRDKIILTLQKGYVSTTDPDFQDFLAQLLNNAAGRGVQINYAGVAT